MLHPNGRALVQTRSVAFASAALLLLSSTPAAAYIDPGTGSALVYLVTSILVAAYFLVRSLYYRVAEFVFRRRYEYQKCDLAIHCESPRYEITFMPVIRELAKRGVELTYFTMYPRDDSCEALPSGVSHREISPGMAGYAYLNHLEARVLVTTTPQLDVMSFRRSEKVKHYIMLQHALGESRFVRPYAYDFFDTVMCCGEIVKKNIRSIEAIRGFSAKQLLDTGVPHYDELMKSVAPKRETAKPPLVLVAPSWGPLSIFQAFGMEVVEHLAARYEVVVRPHPQMKASQPDVYEKVLALDGVEIDTSATPADVMARADVLVSDISGITHEFAFIHEKPVVIIDQHTELGGLEGELLGGDSDLKERCAEFIVPIPPSQIETIADVVAMVMERHSLQRIAEVREQTIYNFGHAGCVAAEQIEEILSCN